MNEPTRTGLMDFVVAIGYVPQTPYLADDSVAANVAFGIPAEHRDQARVNRVLPRRSAFGPSSKNSRKGFIPWSATVDRDYQAASV